MSAAPWRYVAVAWQVTPRPWAPLPCQACGDKPGTVALYEGRVWRLTLCVACAERHRAVHGEQLELFGEEREGGREKGGRA